MSDRIPAEVFPPGEFIRDEIEARGWTQAELAKILGRPLKTVSDILLGKRKITPETAHGLGEAFGVDPQFWLNLESAYKLSLVRTQKGDVAVRAKLRECLEQESFEQKREAKMPWVEDRRVYVNTQGTQTVKVCSPRNIRGEYEKYYRIRPPLTMTQRQMEDEVSRFNTLAELEGWLMSDRRARRERDKEVAPPSRVSVDVAKPSVETLPALPEPRTALPAPAFEITPGDAESQLTGETEDTLSEILDLVSPSVYSPDTDAWLTEAKMIVEAAIDKVVREFVENPYLHRVEHSIHAELFGAITAQGDFSQRHILGDNLGVTQLVHKEWPETTAREGKRRGNFDLAVLSPHLLKACQGIDMFLEGRLPAPIVLEIGLDYDVEHLAYDAKKLINSKPKFGYLVHLVRNVPSDAMTEQIILGLEAKTGIRTAYARVSGSQKEYKLLSENKITKA